MSFGILIAYIIGAVVEWQVMCFVIGSLPIVLGLSMVNKRCILETNAQGKEIHLRAFLSVTVWIVLIHQL